ncbi:MAG: phosphatase PAP2 family protein [Eudoraea sp.]|nr:phosphatase PAP2 family protein [Eudoraea sp.]
MWEELIHLDKDLFLFLNQLGSERWDAFWMVLTNKGTAVPLYVVLLILSYSHLGWKKTLMVLISVALLITCTDQLANFFKYGVMRLRPCYDPELGEQVRLVKASCGGKYGYFSAHAANSFAIALFFGQLLNKRFPYLKIILILWALIVAYSRIYIGVHFPLDVLTGLAIGALFGWTFARLYIFAAYKFRL